eukprot:g1656.t1
MVTLKLSLQGMVEDAFVSLHRFANDKELTLLNEEVHLSAHEEDILFRGLDLVHPLRQYTASTFGGQLCLVVRTGNAIGAITLDRLSLSLGGMVRSSIEMFGDPAPGDEQLIKIIKGEKLQLRKLLYSPTVEILIHRFPQQGRISRSLVNKGDTEHRNSISAVFRVIEEDFNGECFDVVAGLVSSGRPVDRSGVGIVRAVGLARATQVSLPSIGRGAYEHAIMIDDPAKVAAFAQHAELDLVFEVYGEDDSEVGRVAIPLTQDGTLSSSLNLREEVVGPFQVTVRVHSDSVPTSPILRDILAGSSLDRFDEIPQADVDAFVPRLIAVLVSMSSTQSVALAARLLSHSNSIEAKVNHPIRLLRATAECLPNDSNNSSYITTQANPGWRLLVEHAVRHLSPGSSIATTALEKCMGALGQSAVSDAEEAARGILRAVASTLGEAAARACAAAFFCARLSPAFFESFASIMLRPGTGERARVFRAVSENLRPDLAAAIAPWVSSAEEALLFRSSVLLCEPLLSACLSRGLTLESFSAEALFRMLPSSNPCPDADYVRLSQVLFEADASRTVQLLPGIVAKMRQASVVAGVEASRRRQLADEQPAALGQLLLHVVVATKSMNMNMAESTAESTAHMQWLDPLLLLCGDVSGQLAECASRSFELKLARIASRHHATLAPMLASRVMLRMSDAGPSWWWWQPWRSYAAIMNYPMNTLLEKSCHVVGLFARSSGLTGILEIMREAHALGSCERVTAKAAKMAALATPQGSFARAWLMALVGSPKALNLALDTFIDLGADREARACARMIRRMMRKESTSTVGRAGGIIGDIFFLVVMFGSDQVEAQIEVHVRHAALQHEDVRERERQRVIESVLEGHMTIVEKSPCWESLSEVSPSSSAGASASLYVAEVSLLEDSAGCAKFVTHKFSRGMTARGLVFATDSELVPFVPRVAVHAVALRRASDVPIAGGRHATHLSWPCLQWAPEAVVHEWREEDVKVLKIQVNQMALPTVVEKEEMKEEKTKKKVKTEVKTEKMEKAKLSRKGTGSRLKAARMK